MIKRFIVLILFAGLFLCASCAENRLVLSEIPEDSQIDLNNTNASYENASFSDANEKKKAGCVYICGAVEKPGIYEFYEGARLYELIEEAGGLDEEADADAVNLAMEVKDAQQIRIPYIGETIASDEEKLIDLNTASTADLCTIPGIGESRATAIIEYREKNGGFSDIEELKNISGIKDATFEKIKPYVCVR
ncbi:MAG: helix-hairpin-helix domain-containing protein [Lachnospiraceae bacterium]|nr:helix-hairpin-helix domain-containing protein [Lachnospiraceae bacterium]